MSSQLQQYNWKLHRGGRISPSNFCEVRHKKFDDEGNQNTRSFFNKLIIYTTTLNVLTITYGQENEKRTQYKTLSLQEHQNFVMQNTGLHINAEFPYLGAAPDSLSQCDYHGKGVLEIKCPHNYRYGLKNWQQDKSIPIDESYQIKIDHKYYYQIQGQMFILNLDYCGFFIWSSATSADYPNFLKIQVEQNDEFINDMSVKPQNCFFKVLLAEVVTRKNDICADNK